MHASSSRAAVVMRPVLLMVLALGVLLGLVGMHELDTGPGAGTGAAGMVAAAPVGHAIAGESMGAAAGDAGLPAASAVAPAPMGDMAHTMETCCVALAVVLALAMLASPGALGALSALRPRPRLAPAGPPRAMRGIELQLSLGVLRI